MRHFTYFLLLVSTSLLAQTPPSCPTITVSWTATGSNAAVVTNQTQPASVTMNLPNGGSMQVSSLSANVPTSNLRFIEKMTSNGNVIYQDNVVDLNRATQDVDISYFNRSHGTYTLVNTQIAGVLSETFTPYVDVNNNWQFDPATECLGQPTVLVYNIAIPLSGPTNGLIAYYPFNGNANDGSGNNNNGAVQGATLVSDRRGTPNGAYRFADGAKIVVSNSTSLTLNNAYTFSGWFKLISFAGRDGVSYSLSQNRGVHPLFSKNCDRDWIYSLLEPTSEIAPRYGILGGTWSGYIRYFANLRLNTWMHIAQVYSEGTMVLYINGMLIADAKGTNNLAASNQRDLIIGGMGCTPYFFNGELDDFRFYNRGLSESEIKSIFLNENGPIQSIKTGSWLDPTTWSCSCIPTSANAVEVKHVVNVPATQTGFAFSLKYGVGGRVDLGANAKLQLIDQ